MNIRILIAYDQAIFRDGLRRLLGEQPGLLVVGETADARQAVQVLPMLEPDVLLLDLAAPVHGLSALTALRNAASGVRTIVLATDAQREAQVAALQLGARGIVLKNAPTAVLVKAIRAVFTDHYWFGDDGASDVDGAMRRLSGVESAREAKDRFRLTPREMEIVWAVAVGDSNKSIADRLSIAEITVKHHLSHVFDKLGVFSRVELALFALNHGLVQDSVAPPRRQSSPIACVA
jgi:two-component system nitrate/nitrite response regulator NarL